MTVAREEAWRVRLKLLVGLDEFLVDAPENFLVDRVIKARHSLMMTEGEDFGFEPLDWLSFFTRTKDVDIHFRDLITRESSTPRFRRLRELAEGAVTQDPGLMHPDRFKLRNEFFKKKVLLHLKEKQELPWKEDFDEWAAMWDSMNNSGEAGCSVDPPPPVNDQIG